MEQKNPTHADLRHRPLGVVDSDEECIVEVRKHVFGLISMYVVSVAGLLAVFALAVFILPTMLGTQPDYVLLVTVLIFLMATIVVLGLFVATIVYRQSRLLVTNKNLTQVIQYSLFNRKISQLSMNNVEDVTAVQNGIIPHMFDFGVLRIETAGEQSNFHFDYCPSPNKIAKEILEAREAFIEMPQSLQKPRRSASQRQQLQEEHQQQQAEQQPAQPVQPKAAQQAPPAAEQPPRQ
jgi:uncharacterized membrane protein YdbT with pleckstrin-like domain